MSWVIILSISYGGVIEEKTFVSDYFHYEYLLVLFVSTHSDHMSCYKFQYIYKHIRIWMDLVASEGMRGASVVWRHVRLIFQGRCRMQIDLRKVCLAFNIYQAFSGDAEQKKTGVIKIYISCVVISK